MSPTATRVCVQVYYLNRRAGLTQWDPPRAWAGSPCVRFAFWLEVGPL